MEEKPSLFVLEDDDKLLKAIAKVANFENWNVHHAGSIDEAVDVVRRHGDEISLAFIDLAVPEDRRKLDQVERLSARRRELMDNFAGSDPTADRSLEELRQLRQDLVPLDDEIARLVDINGGINFLRNEAVREHLGNWSVIVFSARDRGGGRLAEVLGEATATCRKLDGKSYRWLQKPISPYEVVQNLRSVRKSLRDA